MDNVTEVPEATTPVDSASEKPAETPADVKKPTPAKPKAAKPVPTPKPSALPKPKPVAKPAAAAPAAPVEPEVPTESVEQLAARGRTFGRVTDGNVVFVTSGDEEREIGSYPGVSEDEALAYFVRKYDELSGQVTLVEQRLELAEPPVKEIGKSLRTLTPLLEEAHVLGDIPALRDRVAAAEEKLAEARLVVEKQRAEAKVKAAAERDVIVADAEKIAAQPPERVSWKAAGDKMKALFEQWKQHQHNSIKLDKLVEEELWQRFKTARSTFDRNRRTHFAALDRQHAEAKTAKEALVEEAQKLSSSTEWGATSAAYRDLMTRWKATGRAGRKDDDALWERFRAAQDVFFAARTAANAEQDKEFEANLAVKEELLKEAEALLPITNVNHAKKALRTIGAKWDEAGKVPRSAMQRVEERLKAVEQAVREADGQKWKSANPEGKARAEGALGQLHAAIAKLEAELETAQAKGDAKKIAKAEEALTARRAWLEQVEKAAQDFS